MNTQINLRLPEKMLISAQTYSNKHGFSSMQEFIKETIREKLFEEPPITKEELAMIKVLFTESERKNLYGTEEELFKRLRKK
jgi:Arc/MetJ-type ribon-helix-helix transcriptional regulator